MINIHIEAWLCGLSLFGCEARAINYKIHVHMMFAVYKGGAHISFLHVAYIIYIFYFYRKNEKNKRKKNLSNFSHVQSSG